MHKVVVFKETLLPPSETFILAQMKELQEYEPVLAGLERAYPSLTLPHKPFLLSTQRQSISDARAKLYRRTGTAPLFHQKVKSAHPHLVHAHFACGGRTALPLARSLGVPLVVTLHGNDVTVHDQAPELYRRLRQEASLFICVSHFIRDRAVEAGYPENKLIVHYTGIDRTAFTPSDSPTGSQRVLFVGRLVEKKGCAYLVRAMQTVQRTLPESLLTVIGDGPLRSSLETLASELGLRCEFLGTQPAAVVRETLGATRLLCVPSVTAEDGDSEGLGMVFAEAQAMGVPVVSTTHGGIPEVVVNGKTGLLVPERDSAALADAISLLLSDKSLWRQFRSAAVQHIEEHFDLRTQANQLESIYNGVLASA